MREQKIELREIETDYSTGTEYDNNNTASGSKNQSGQSKSWPQLADSKPCHGDKIKTDSEQNILNSREAPDRSKDAFPGKHKRSSTV